MPTFQENTLFKGILVDLSYYHLLKKRDWFMCRLNKYSSFRIFISLEIFLYNLFL